MPPRARALPPELPVGFSISDARAAGVTDRRVRGADLVAPFYGVRVQQRAIDSVVDSARKALSLDVSAIAVAAECHRSLTILRAAAYARFAPSHFFYSHVLAGVIWGVPLPLRVLMRDSRPWHVARTIRSFDADHILRNVSDLDVSTLSPHRAPRGTGVRGRQLAPAVTSLRIHGGLRVVSPATMWAQLGSVLSVDELIAIGDAVVHEPRNGVIRGPSDSGLGTLAQLDAAMNVGRRPGASRLREARTQIRVGSASDGETDLRLAVVRAGLPEPTLDIDVTDANGRVIGFTELAYPAFRLLLEYEGDHHRTDRAQWNRDIEKRAQCAAAGWTVVQITAQQLYPRPDAAVRNVRDALLRAGWRPRLG